MFLSYLRTGITLANKNLKLYIIGFLFALSISLLNLAKQGSLVQFVGIILVLLQIGFIFSLPYLLYRSDEKIMNFKFIANLVLKNLKRLILPAIALGAVYALLFVIAFIIFSLLGISTTTVVSFITHDFKYKTISINSLVIALIFSLVATPQTFAATLFSVENKNFFRSVFKSISLSIRHMRFLLPLSVILFMNFLLTTLLSSQGVIGGCIKTLISSYLELVLVGTILSYYLKNIHRAPITAKES